MLAYILNKILEDFRTLPDKIIVKNARKHIKNEAF